MANAVVERVEGREVVNWMAEGHRYHEAGQSMGGVVRCLKTESPGSR